MRKTQLQKRKAIARRPEYFERYYYYSFGGRTAFKLTKEQADQWHSFCREINAARPDDSKPNRDDYETFVHRYLNA